MADTLVERITGQTAAAGPVEIGLVMTDQALFGGADTAAELTGYGPIPAPLARNLIHRATGATGGQAAGVGASAGAGVDGAAAEAAEAAAVEAARVYLRRLYTDPATGTITSADPQRRRFTGPPAAYLIYRDQHCRTPYCEAPIRHRDHITPHAAGGPTTADNGQGSCERCNYIKQLPGWSVRLIDADRHIVETTTPTGHTYRSHPPPAPGHTTRARAPARAA